MHKFVGLLRMRRHSLGDAGGVKGRVRRDDGRSVGSLGVYGGLEVAAQVIGLGRSRGIIDRIAVGAIEAERRSIALITAAAAGAGARRAGDTAEMQTPGGRQVRRIVGQGIRGGDEGDWCRDLRSLDGSSIACARSTSNVQVCGLLLLFTLDGESACERHC